MITAADRILVVAPHADDELIGMGGSLLKWKSIGAEIHIVLVACSDVEMVHTKSVVSGETRASEFREVCKKISNTEPKILGYNDSYLDTYPISEIVTILDTIIEDFRPSVVAYPEPSYHQDHQVVNRACTASLRPTKLFRPDLIMTYEIPTSTWTGSGRNFEPNFFVDISDQMTEKISLFENIYKSQFTVVDRQKLASSGINDHASYRGMECGHKYAESFRILHSRG